MSLGTNIKVTVFGQSHSPAMGAVAEGLPAGGKVDTERLERFMERRAPGRNRFSTQRAEADKVKIISGINGEGVLCGAPLSVIIENTDQRSGDYKNIADVPRPGHADYAAYVKYGGNNDIRGGGQFSGRLTAPLCAVGGICIQLLEERGVYIGAHIAAVHGVKDALFDAVNPNAHLFNEIAEKDFPVIDDERGELMKKEIDKARTELNSVGGIIECEIAGMPAGLGGPLFEGIEGEMSKALFGIPAVKGVEFGAGFSAAEMLGSENNDIFYYEGDKVKTATNNHGGILGGISSGMPVIFRVAVKPTPSIGKTQKSVSLSKKENAELNITGRHDPCVVQRAVPVVEAVAAIVTLDLIMERCK
ncbi:MAG: chorismate synthase [Bacillota bacterium]|nr:chorismate synthase [Bacillota bacterium]